MKDKPWCVLVFAILILVFTFWQTSASFWIVWIAAALILIRTIFSLSGSCKVKKKSKK
ncbi:MAG: hypothetical protein KC516_03050 [Nanoarchaeota archaeon]|nr:hypothetical protein [Nanoarchaeota archaeon]